MKGFTKIYDTFINVTKDLPSAVILSFLYEASKSNLTMWKKHYLCQRFSIEKRALKKVLIKLQENGFIGYVDKYYFVEVTITDKTKELIKDTKESKDKQSNELSNYEYNDIDTIEELLDTLILANKSDDDIQKIIDKWKQTHEQ